MFHFPPAISIAGIYLPQRILTLCFTPGFEARFSQNEIRSGPMGQTWFVTTVLSCHVQIGQHDVVSTNYLVFFLQPGAVNQWMWTRPHPEFAMKNLRGDKMGTGANPKYAHVFGKCAY